MQMIQSIHPTIRLAMRFHYTSSEFLSSIKSIKSIMGSETESISSAFANILDDLVVFSMVLNVTIVNIGGPNSRTEAIPPT